MNAEQISDLDKRLSIQEATLTRVLEAQERAANSTEELNKSVTEMTTEFRYIRTDVSRAQETADKALSIAKNNDTEIKVIKSANKWQDWAGKAIVVALVGAVMGLIVLN